MYFINRIVEYLSDISDFFYDACLEVHSWVWPFWYLYVPLYALSLAFNKLAKRFSDFGDWVDDVADKLAAMATWSQILSMLSYWLDMAEDAWAWVRYAWSNVTSIIDDWWEVAKETIEDVVVDIPQWIITKINDLHNIVLFLIQKYMEIDIPTGITDAVMTLFNNLKDWAIEQIDNTIETLTSLITDIENWAITEINTMTETIAALVTDIENLPIDAINNLIETITNLISWDALWDWLTPWWNDRLRDLSDLIDSRIREWFPFFDSIVEFFKDPLEWLLNRFFTWFLGQKEE